LLVPSAAATAAKGTSAAQTPRVTITTGTDFTTVFTGTGAGTALIYYQPYVGTAGGKAEAPNTYDLTGVVVTMEAIGF